MISLPKQTDSESLTNPFKFDDADKLTSSGPTLSSQGSTPIAPFKVGFQDLN